MQYALDLSGFSKTPAYADGAALLKSCPVQVTGMASLGCQVDGKVADSFNFVSHVQLRASQDLTALVGYRCDCPYYHRSGTACKHILALAMACNDDTDKYFVRSALPEAAATSEAAGSEIPDLTIPGEEDPFVLPEEYAEEDVEELVEDFEESEEAEEAEEAEETPDTEDEEPVVEVFQEVQQTIGDTPQDVNMTTQVFVVPGEGNAAGFDVSALLAAQQEQIRQLTEQNRRLSDQLAELLKQLCGKIPAEPGPEKGPAEKAPTEQEKTPAEEKPRPAQETAREDSDEDAPVLDIPDDDFIYIPADLPEFPEEDPEELEEEPAETPEEPAPPAEPARDFMEIHFGRNLDDDSAVNWHPTNTEEVFHTNTGIIGTMGTGKTQFTQSLVLQMMREQKRNFGGNPINFLIFDYKGDYNETKEKFVKSTGARVLKPYLLPFNPLALPRIFRPALPTHVAESFVTTLVKVFRLGPVQQELLLTCIMEAYAKQGINPREPATWTRRAPTFEQVYQIYRNATDSKNADSLTTAMNRLHNFDIFESHPAKTKSLGSMLKGVTVFDLSGYDSSIQNLVVTITLDLLYTHMQTCGSSETDGRYRQLRYMVLVDEADNFLREDFPAMRKLMKEGREFGVGTILSTQSLTHFVTGKDNYARYIWTWVVHNASDLKPADVETVFHLKRKDEIERSYNRIKGLRKHESLVKVSESKPVAIRDKAFFEIVDEPTR